MRTPQDVEDAKALYNEEKAKFTGALSTVAGSRWLTAIAASLALSFGATLAYAPGRLPHLSGVGFTTFGLPDDLDFGAVGEQAVEAGNAAIEQGAREEATGLLAANADWIPAINGGAFALTLIVLLVNLWVMTKRRRISRG
ncbi:MAG: hypothetical protein ABL883_05625 [Terricaulis sp.]